jgi:hypothetical protein
MRRSWFLALVVAVCPGAPAVTLADDAGRRAAPLDDARAPAERRQARLGALASRWPRWVFVKHDDRALAGANHFSYTEALSDSRGRYARFYPGGALCVLVLDGGEPRVEVLLSDLGGVFRDPDVSFDGKRVLFAWKKSSREDDYHLYEMDAATRSVRQLTHGKGVADFEGIYLPGGDIVFSSSRCVQNIDCDYNEVSNLYLCDGNGGRIRRVGFDQVTTCFPSLLGDGTILYTRWDYNDRSQVWPQGLFRMNPDGTGQAEYYGNTSWFPTSILHARGVPGTACVLAVLGGHHTHQRGKLALIDRSRGTQEADGVQLIAPLRKTVAVRIDEYGQDGDQFRYPYPLTPTTFLVSYSPRGGRNREYAEPYGLYWMDADGQRELLASDPALGCYHAVPLAAREPPPRIPSTVDHAQKHGVYFVQDIYTGMGLQGVPRDTIVRLRVVALEYRYLPIGQTTFSGPGGGSWSTCPISIGTGSYDVKRILGSVPIDEDGSACFVVPAQTPVYFQAVDGRGCVVQTMRSWSTLQPGEQRGCVGCHESKHATPQARHVPLALRRPPRRLDPFYGPPRGFSFAKEIQPILDRHCVACHGGSVKGVPGVRPAPAYDLTSAPAPGGASKRIWTRSYLTLTKGRGDVGTPHELVNWLNVQSVPSELPPYHAGAATSRILRMLEDRHEGVRLSPAEMETFAAWIDLLVPYCGDYTEANAWTDAERQAHKRYETQRAEMERLEAYERR